jgi:hypothetical protein
LDCTDFLIERQDVGFWTDWRNREWVDLLVTLGVMVLDVRELGGAAECAIVPVAMSNPSITKSALGNKCRLFDVRTCELLGSHCVYREYCT